MTVDTSSTALRRRQRRRSLKALLQLSLFPRRPAITPPSHARCPASRAPHLAPRGHPTRQELTPADILNLPSCVMSSSAVTVLLTDIRRSTAAAAPARRRVRGLTARPHVLAAVRSMPALISLDL
ncbi:hypothetical protein GGX14DRAFT_578965 [Mycena pura]|uniref:Uncharacterized protein n=1 Tax=Mycena pura TaxID=153505 RepID=A0AAD6XXC9_9AGAR|nr:hypothetical protein GGX14DRAFT_578965 [Mycena pura]